jgi:hypothetical protein
MAHQLDRGFGKVRGPLFARIGVIEIAVGQLIGLKLRTTRTGSVPYWRLVVHRSCPTCNLLLAGFWVHCRPEPELTLTSDHGIICGAPDRGIIYGAAAYAME